MSKVNVSADVLAKIANFARGGDVIAATIQALLNNDKVITFASSAEVANVITVAGQITESDGTKPTTPRDVVITSIPIAGAGTIAAGTTGTIKAGAGTKTAWIVSTTDGLFSFTVTNIVAEENLLVVQLNNGQTETVKLVFT